MSWKNYNRLATIPTFDPVPHSGLGEVSRGRVEIGQAETFARWNGTTGLAFRFRYLTRSRSEWKTLRDELRSSRGQGSAFYLPTWQPDFVIAADAVAGASQILVEDGGFSDLTDDFPDTEGRIVFFLKTDLSVQFNRVTAAADNGANEDVFLEDPLDFDLEADLDMMGFVYLVRLAENQIAFESFAPGRGYCDLRFLTVRASRDVNTVETVESEAP
jgi:hypothetical protein